MSDRHHNPLVSIVIIAYNDERHIADAIESVRNQTLREIEIICVDDGSTDGTLQKMQKIAAQDNRITVLTQSNSGTQAARSSGVLSAHGDYCMLLDSDDWLEPNAAEYLYRIIQERGVEVLEFGTAPFPDELYPSTDLIDAFRIYHSPDRVLPNEITKGKLIRVSFAERQISWTLWSKMYLTSLIQSVYQAECDAKGINHCEDKLTSLLVFNRAKSFDRINTVLHHYRVGTGMSTSSHNHITKQYLKSNAMLFRILLLAKEKIGPIPPDDIDLAIGMKAFENDILEELVDLLVERIPAENRPEFLGYIRQIANSHCIQSPGLFFETAIYDLIDRLSQKCISTHQDSINAQNDIKKAQSEAMQTQNDLLQAQTDLQNYKRIHESLINESHQAYNLLAQNYRALDHTLYEVYNSTTWKVGRMVTAIPRHIKRLLTRE